MVEVAGSASDLSPEARKRDAERKEVAKKAAKSARDAATEVGRREFTITKFAIHEDGYPHARVTVAGLRPLYVHRRWGSWLAPGKDSRGQEVLKEVTSMPVKEELQRKARQLEKHESEPAEGGAEAA